MDVIGILVLFDFDSIWDVVNLVLFGVCMYIDDLCVGGEV